VKPKTDLEQQIDELRTKLDALAERVRLGAVARAFLDNVRGADSVRDGDIALIDGHPTRVRISDHGIGKWTFTTGAGHHLEAFRVPPSDDIVRLYTPEEVAEILANGCSRDTVNGR
jgi:hypothetical protein